MAANIDRRTMWNEGAGYGMILGVVSGVFIFLNMGTAALAENGGAGLKMLAVALNAGLWLVKFLACLWLMRFFMLKFVAGHKGADNRQSFRLGVIVAMTSAVVYSGINLLNICVISPGTVEEAIKTMMDSFSSMPGFSDSDMASIERSMGMYPQIAFFSNLIYCFIYGAIVAKIFSTGIPPRDIFAGEDNEPEQ
ncbi:MAG: DUF4199 domain-containing protein [Candidatus Cryptobacteroides sp.]